VEPQRWRRRIINDAMMVAIDVVMLKQRVDRLPPMLVGFAETIHRHNCSEPSEQR
jgi:hypothetical protein